MKIRIRPDDPSMLKEPDWRQMNEWLAELRDDGRAEPDGAGHTQPTATGQAGPSGVRLFEQARGSDHRPEARPPGPPNRPVARAGRGTRTEAHDSPEITVRAIIGDQLRIPVMWCEMGSCISWHTDPAALGEADTRARAIEAGWRVDALGRLACPRCQQTDPGFRASHPVALWNREEAINMAARISVVHGDRTASTRPFPVPPRD